MLGTWAYECPYFVQLILVVAMNTGGSITGCLWCVKLDFVVLIENQRMQRTCEVLVVNINGHIGCRWCVEFLVEVVNTSGHGECP